MKKGTTIKVKIKIKSKKDDLPDYGLGKGIIAEQEFTLLEDVTDSNKYRFFLKRDEIYDKLLNETIEPVFEIDEND